MAWANSGLYPATLAASLSGTANAPNWVNAAPYNKFFLTNNSDATLYAAALASAVYSSHSGANEVSGTGWAAGGIAVSALAAGSTSLAPTLTVTGTAPVLMSYNVTNNISVAGTTLTGAFGGYFYSTNTTLYLIMGIYFGGSGYSTTAGTFAVTFSGAGPYVVATVNCAANT